MIERVKEFINAVCQPHWFMILSVLGLVIFLRFYRTLTRPAVAGPLAALGLLAFLASCMD